MRCQLILVDLTKDGGLVVDGLGLPPQKSGRQACNVAGESQLRSWQHAYRQSRVIRGGEPARSRPEVTRHELVTDFRRPRPYALKAKVTHWRLLSSRVFSSQGFRCTAPATPTTASSKNGAVPETKSHLGAGKRPSGVSE